MPRLEECRSTGRAGSGRAAGAEHPQGAVAPGAGQGLRPSHARSQEDRPPQGLQAQARLGQHLWSVPSPAAEVGCIPCPSWWGGATKSRWQSGHRDRNTTGQGPDSPRQHPSGRKEEPEGAGRRLLSGSSSSKVLLATSGPLGDQRLPGCFHPDGGSPAPSRRSVFSLGPHAVQPACAQSARPPPPCPVAPRPAQPQAAA